MSEFERVSEFTVGSVIGNTWTMFCKKPMAFMLCVFLSGVLSALLIGVGVFIAGLAGFSAVHANPMAIANFGAGTIVTVLVGALAAIIVSMLVAILVQGAIIYATFRIFMNGQVSMSEAFGRSISRVPILLLSGGLTQLALFGLLMLAALLSAAAGWIFGSTLGFVLIVLIVLCAIVYSVILGCMWSVFPPACVVERLGPVASLSRSAELTKGYRGTLFWVLVLLFVISVVFFLITALIGGGIGYVTHKYIGDLVGFLLRLPFFACLNILPAVAYYKLRIVKEGLAPESLADIFD